MGVCNGHPASYHHIGSGGSNEDSATECSICVVFGFLVAFIITTADHEYRFNWVWILSLIVLICFLTCGLITCCCPSCLKSSYKFCCNWDVFWDCGCCLIDCGFDSSRILCRDCCCHECCEIDCGLRKRTSAESLPPAN